MKQTVWIKGCLLGMLILFGGCAGGAGAGLAKGFSAPDIPEPLEQDTYERKYERKEELCFVPEQAEIEDSELKFGRLIIHLPGEASVQAEEPAEEKGQVLEVSGLGEDKAAPPRMRFARYLAKYNEEIELASAILREIQGEILEVAYADREASGGPAYGFQMKDGIYRKYIVVHGEELYLLEEIRAEEDYSISFLLEQKSVSWDQGKEIPFGQQYSDNYGYIELKPEENVRLVAVNGDIIGGEDFRVYREGDYETPCQSFSGQALGGTSRVDLNFDGYEDLRFEVGTYAAYLWNHEEQCYEKVVCSANDISLNFMNLEFFEEEKTLYSTDWDWDAEGEVSKEMEALWQWEGNELVLKRECLLEISQAMARIQVLEGVKGEVLLDRSFSRKKWEDNQEFLCPFYEQFYEGLAPEGIYELKHGRKGEGEYISEKLLNRIAEGFENQEEEKVLNSLVSGRNLTEEEIRSLAEEHMDIRVDLAEARWGGYVMLEADMDNDGISDLLAESYLGGTGGFTDSILYQGQEDGSYVKTDVSPHILEEFACIHYEGKNYLCRTTYDYRRKEYNGVCLYYYEEGRRVEEAAVRLVLDSYEVKVAECAGEQRMIFAKGAADKSIGIREGIEEYKIPVGNGEQEIPTETGSRYKSDFDNDGETEEYEKYIWTSTNMFTADCLEFAGEGGELIAKLLAEAGNPGIALWVDEENGENIISVMYLTGLYDYQVAGYLARGDEYEQVYRIAGKAKVRVEIDR